MTPEMKIRRHGYHLMSLASLGIVAAAAIGLFLALLVFCGGAMPFGNWVLFDLPMDEATRLGAGDRGLLALALVLGTLAYILPLAAVHRVGKALHGCDALSAPVAAAFMRLAHSLPASLLLSVAGACMAAWVRSSHDAWQLRITVSTDPYHFLVACLCLYSVAHLLRLAVRAADDARGIV